MCEYLTIVENAMKAKKTLSFVEKDKRLEALERISLALISHAEEILLANKEDLSCATNLSPVMKKRLELSFEKIKEMARNVTEVKNLEEIIGKNISTISRPNGLIIKKIAVPFGIILAIFESRPNVLVDIASLCIKTGNVCILKGGKEALNTNKALILIIKNAIQGCIDENSVSLITNSNKEVVYNLIKMKDKIDLVIPRGGKNLIETITKNSLIPVIETGAGVCHIYIDENTNLKMGLKILVNAKTSNPCVCNACECLLVHKSIAPDFFKLMKENGLNTYIKIYGDEFTQKYFECEKVFNYAMEFDDLKLNVKVVDSLEEAILHINTFSTKHSETIVTSNPNHSERFLNEVDSACVYVNASTRFTDGGCFGFGCEFGISTQKLHARGPMGINEMMTYKYKIYGNGQIR